MLLLLVENGLCCDLHLPKRQISEEAVTENHANECNHFSHSIVYSHPVDGLREVLILYFDKKLVGVVIEGYVSYP